MYRREEEEIKITDKQLDGIRKGEKVAFAFQHFDVDGVLVETIFVMKYKNTNESYNMRVPCSCCGKPGNNALIEVEPGYYKFLCNNCNNG